MRSPAGSTRAPIETATVLPPNWHKALRLSACQLAEMDLREAIQKKRFNQCLNSRNDIVQVWGCICSLHPYIIPFDDEFTITDVTIEIEPMFASVRARGAHTAANFSWIGIMAVGKFKHARPGHTIIIVDNRHSIPEVRKNCQRCGKYCIMPGCHWTDM
jgi:hypothetical protein